MFRDGKFVARHLEPHGGGELREEQIQPNGVDLTIDKILQHDNQAVLGDDEYIKPDRSEVDKVGMIQHPVDHKEVIDGDEAYALSPGGYVVVYDEEILEIPEGHIGFVWPRSRLLRCSAHLTSAVWDTGYSGRGEGALLVNEPMIVDPNMRIGQMTFVRAQSFGEYDGQHQGERIDE